MPLPRSANTLLLLLVLCASVFSAACAGRGRQAAIASELPPAAASEWLPADLPIRLRMDLGAVRQSVWGPALWSGIREALRELMSEVDVKALELLDQIEIVYLAGTLDEHESRGVLVFEGQAALTKDLSQRLGSEPELRHGWQVYDWGELEAFSPSEGVLVLASASYLETVAVHPSKRTAPLRARPELPEATLALVVEIDEPMRNGMRSQTATDGLVAGLIAPMIDELRSMTFTLGLDDAGLQLHGNFDFSGERGAQLTGALLGYLTSAAQEDDSEAPGNAATVQLLLNELEIDIAGTAVLLDLSLDAVQLGELMRRAREHEGNVPAPSAPGSAL